MISKDRINEDLLDSQFVWDCWETNAKKIPDNVAIIHWDALDKPFRWTYSSLLENSLKIADDLIDMGVKKGDVCALIIRHNKYFYPIYMGIAAIGAIPSVLAYPNPRLHPDKFMQGLSGMAQHSGIDWILTEKDLEPKIKKIINNKSNSIKGFILPLESIKNRGAYEVNWDKIRKAREGAICTDSFLLQHSSGTTGLQKGIVLSHKAVLEHAHRYSRSILLATSDKIASWLPLYHDMGLIAAFHLPLAYGVPIIQIDPFQWVSRPVILLQAISSEKATLAWLPNFAYNFMADRINEEDLKDVRLDCVRMLINCSEPVRESSHQKFIDRFVKYGIKKVCLAACYAMAETTFAVTQTDPGIQAKKIDASSHDLAKNIIILASQGEPKKIFVSSGRPISGCVIKVVDDKNSEIPQDHVGEIVIRSASMFDGYRNNPEKTAEVMKGEWYYSGDYGFCHNGEYYIIGRKKDIIIVAGNNIYPEDIEDVITIVNGVIPGRAVAFGLEDTESGTEQVCVAAETELTDNKEKRKLRLDIIQAGMSIDVTISRVFLVPARWLIKSSSGKLSRKANKDRIFELLEKGQDTDGIK